MRWIDHSKKEESEWELCFAWLPVPVGLTLWEGSTIMVWLEHVERKRKGSHMDCASYTYRLPVKGGHEMKSQRGDTFTEVLLMVAMLLVGLCAGAAIGQSRETALREEAVRVGAAQWVPDKSGKAEFQWSKPEKPTETVAAK